MIRCPKCKRPMFVMCLTSYPPKYECGCNSCGFELRYYDRENNHKNITQEEVNDVWNMRAEDEKTTDLGRHCRRTSLEIG